MIFDTWPRLENETVLLKKMTGTDRPDLEQMLADEDIYRYEPTFLPELTSESCRDFITRDCDRLFREKSALLLGIYPKEEPDRFMGIAELYGYSPVREKISIGYRLRKEYWHKGYATSVVSLLKDYILNDLQLIRITAHVRIENPASERCLLKNGFVQRRAPHEEDWGFEKPVIANKYVIYPTEENRV